MATIERRTLKKAPAMDVVDAFTKEQAPTPATTAQPAGPDAPVAQPAATDTLTERQDAPSRPTRRPDRQSEQGDDDVAPIRRGPGRPRSKRRMESLATKIDIELRDQVDAYLQKTGGTLVDLIDEALRDRLRKK